MMTSVQAPNAPARPRLSQSVAEDLERRIVGGELAPGQLLPTEAQLGVEFHVSRTVVRDAIRTLAARGLVEVRQGSGTRVTAYGVAAFEQSMTTALLRSDLTVGDVIDARAAIELAMIGLASRAGRPEDWSAMEAALDGLAAAIAGEDWEAAHQRHLEFHLGILDAVHLPALELVLRPMHQLVLLSSTPPLPSNPGQWEFEAHAKLLEALRGGHSEQAAEALRGHYRELETDDYAAYRRPRFGESPSVRAIVHQRLGATGHG
jgi:GntR family transcriptional regulator, transcriptional repressor for pyruvate dehydrogenase complex